MASHAPPWAAVGALKLLRHHSAVAGENRPRTSSRLLCAIGPSLPPGTDTTGRSRTRGRSKAGSSPSTGVTRSCDPSIGSSCLAEHLALAAGAMRSHPEDVAEVHRDEPPGPD